MSKGHTQSGYSKDELQTFVDLICKETMDNADWGKVAHYIPELSAIKPEQFAISICLSNGDIISSGQAETPFSIQSISKVFALAIAQRRLGEDYWKRVKCESSGNAFDSIVQLEQEDGIPRNPFINAGAIATTDAVLANNTPKEALAEVLQFVRHAASDNNIYINENVAKSESHTGHKNFALAHFMRAYGTLENTTEAVLGTYFHQCAMEMTCKQLAMTGRMFACFDGDFPNLRHGIINSINALMMIAGHYNGSGDFAKRVGVPGKSGVGGGILAIVPNKASIAVWSPGLNEYGNSKAGTLALEKLSRLTGWSLFT